MEVGFLHKTGPPKEFSAHIEQNSGLSDSLMLVDTFGGENNDLTECFHLIMDLDRLSIILNNIFIISNQ